MDAQAMPSNTTPETSIIIRTFNEEKYLGETLQAIRAQEYTNYEIVLVDSGSLDRTVAIARPHCATVLEIESHDFTFGYALNAGCRAARGTFFVFLSAHAIPAHPQWLGQLLAPFGEERVAMVYGRHVGARTTKFSEQRDFDRYFSADGSHRHPLPYFAINANAAIRAAHWAARPFDEYLTGLEDIAWAKAMYERGNAIRYAAAASVAHIHEERGHQVYNRYRREAIAARHIGIAQPPFAQPSLRFFIGRTCADLWSARAEPRRAAGVVAFRYAQWRGTRQGWLRDAATPLPTMRDELFFSGRRNERVVITGPQHASLEVGDLPRVRPSEVLIRVERVGVCATDTEIFEGSLGYYRDGVARYPVIPGHEFSGVVASTGANVRECTVGDHVIGECVLSCERCAFCVTGARAACQHRREVGVMNADGAYARYVCMPARYVHRIPDELSLDTACLAEPTAVVLRGLRRLGNRLDGVRRCAVIGAGPIGNLCAQILAQRGHAVAAFDRRADRRAYLRPPIEVRETLDHLNEFDVLVEATGHTEPLLAALQGSRSDATLLLLGFPYGRIPFNFEGIVGQEKVVIGSVGGASEDFAMACRVLPQLDTAPFLATVLPLREFQRAWDLHRSQRQLKVLLQVHGA